ncbi:MAG TPA: hypothetical protein VEH48_02795 [Candidatus Nitrosopolaris sp.]|nr:hypothetical protein [Candidatus Nitrosopolaris sp.]
MKTVAIIYGWTGGSWSTRHFRDELQKAGFKVISNREKANIIIAHSAGCYRVPDKTSAQLILLIGVAYWPEKRLRSRAMNRFINGLKEDRDRGVLYIFHRFMWQLFYAIIRPGDIVISLRNHKSLDFLEKLKDKRIILIRNSRDEYCSPNIARSITKYSNIKFVELLGLHDDYYTNPKPYIDLLLKAL